MSGNIYKNFEGPYYVYPERHFPTGRTIIKTTSDPSVLQGGIFHTVSSSTPDTFPMTLPFILA